MKRNTGLFLFALCPLIPATAKFSYALVMAAALFFFFFAGLFFREIVKKIDGGNSGSLLELACLAGASALFVSVMHAVYPILAVTLEMYVYVAAFSFVLLLSVDSFSYRSINVPPVIAFIPIMVSFAAVRELIGCGVISLPTHSGMLEVPVFERFGFSVVRFWGTTGGALILAGFFTWLFRLLVSDRGAGGKQA